MRTEHLLFLVLRIALKCRAKVSAYCGGCPLAPGSLLLTLLRQWFWCGSSFMLIREGISCCFVFYCKLFVVCRSGSTTSAWDERASFCAIVYM